MSPILTVINSLDRVRMVEGLIYLHKTRQEYHFQLISSLSGSILDVSALPSLPHVQTHLGGCRENPRSQTAEDGLATEKREKGKKMMAEDDGQHPTSTPDTIFAYILSAVLIFYYKTRRSGRVKVQIKKWR